MLGLESDCHPLHLRKPCLCTDMTGAAMETEREELTFFDKCWPTAHAPPAASEPQETRQDEEPASKWPAQR